jgi:hypothetical protein
LRGISAMACIDANIPCRNYERNDGKNGVFSIREMPETNNTNN